MEEFFNKYLEAEKALESADMEIKAAEQKRYNANSAMSKIKRDALTAGISIKDFKIKYAEWKKDQTA